MSAISSITFNFILKKYKLKQRLIFSKKKKGSLSNFRKVKFIGQL
jgi:hypothetical protein